VALVRSKIYGILARIAITMAAVGLFMVIRGDITNSLRQKVLAKSIERATPDLIEDYIRLHPVRNYKSGPVETIRLAGSTAILNLSWGKPILTPQNRFRCRTAPSITSTASTSSNT
jgi:hypothetical protein